MRIDRCISVKTDHISMLNFNIATSATLLFDLGFVRGGGRTALDNRVMEMTAPTVRFVFDNAYIECVQFPPEISEFYHLLNTPAGIHIIALLTPDAETAREQLLTAGLSIDEIEQVSRRNVDYGEKKGTVVFRMVPLPEEIIPRTHVAFLEHRTRELMYQTSRCAHLNGVTRMEEVTLCCQTEEAARQIETELSRLCALAKNGACEGGMERLRLMDPDTLYERYGLRSNPDGSAFVMIRFGTPDLGETERYLRRSGYSVRKENGMLFSGPFERLNMVFSFSQI